MTKETVKCGYCDGTGVNKIGETCHICQGCCNTTKAYVDWLFNRDVMAQIALDMGNKAQEKEFVRVMDEWDKNNPMPPIIG